MIHREQWGAHPDWLRWVRRAWKPGGRVQLQHGSDPARIHFASRAALSFARLGVPFAHIKTWVSVQEPADGAGYAEGYPHVHHPLDGMTLVHYLQTGDKPAPLHIFDGDSVIEEIRPTVGLTVFMPNDLRHGVLNNNGTIDRVQVIATALK